MKVSFEVENFGEVVTIIEVIHKRKVAACIFTVAVLLILSAVLVAYWMLKH